MVCQGLFEPWNILFSFVCCFLLRSFNPRSGSGKRFHRRKGLAGAFIDFYSFF